MKEIKFDIIKFAYTKQEENDVSFIPMLLRRKLNSFGRAALYTLYNAYNGNNDVNLVFASDYGDYERVKKLTAQRKEEGEISPAGFSFSVHNASIGLFSLLEKIKNEYVTISAGENTFSYGLLNGIMNCENKDCLYCFCESFNGLKSLSVMIHFNQNGEYILKNSNSSKEDSSVEEFIDFLENKNPCFNNSIYSIQRV